MKKLFMTALAVSALSGVSGIAAAQGAGPYSKGPTDLSVTLFGCPPNTGSINFKLGSMSANLSQSANANFANFSDQFDVAKSPANQPNLDKFFSCFSLHLMQIVRDGAAPATYKGVVVPAGQIMIDTPNGGWDYMYPGGDRTQPPLPAFANWVTATDKHPNPWYYNESVGEAAFNTVGTKYRVEDGPAYRPNKDVKFSTYLVATPKANCDSQGCLKLGEFAVLQGLDWTIRKNVDDAGAASYKLTLSDIRTATAADVTDINTGLTNSDYGKWKAFSLTDRKLCCDAVPEPASLLPLGGGMAWMLVRRRRKAA